MKSLQAALRRPIEALPELIGPDYSIYRYQHNFYKVIRFTSTAPRFGHVIHRSEDGPKNTDKLSQSISRARRICLELALCNEWKWFATFTIAENNYDRKNWEGYYEKFTDWLKRLRKKHGISQIDYLLVPEQHADGSWHMHGFFTDAITPFLVSFKDLWDSGADVPYKLVCDGYYNWPSYQKKFGYCSLGLIRNQTATAFYVTKYISKSFQEGCSRVGLNLYYATRGLNRSVLYGDVYGRNNFLDLSLQNHYQHCSTGFIRLNREPGDDPLLDIIEQQELTLYHMELEDPAEAEADSFYEMMQTCIDGF